MARSRISYTTGSARPCRFTAGTLLRALTALTTLVAGLLLAFYPTILSGFRRLQVDEADTRFNNYLLEHSYRWVTRDPLHSYLWDPPFFYPANNVLAYGDTLLTVAPLYWIWRALRFAPDVAFGLWMITVSVLNFAAAWLLLRHAVGANWLGCALGAFIISFGNARLAQLGHQQLLPHFWTLLAIHSLLVVFRQGPTLPSIAVGFWVCLFFCSSVAQLYASYYYGYFLVLIVLIAFLWGLARPHWRAQMLYVLRTCRKAIATSSLIAVLLLVPLAYHYLLAAAEVGVRGPGSDRQGLPRLLSYVWMGKDNLLYGWMGRLSWFQSLPMRHEQAIGLGMVTSAVTVWFLWRYRTETWVRVVAAVMVTAFVCFTMFPGGVRLWRVWYYALPGIQGIRVMARIGILLLLPAGMAVATLVRTTERSRYAWVGLLIALVCCVEQARFHRWYDRDACRRRVEQLAARIDRSSVAFYVTRARRREGGLSKWHLDAMWAATLSGVPTINGYSGNFPPGWDLYRSVIRNKADERRIAVALRSWIARHSQHLSRVQWVRVPRQPKARRSRSPRGHPDRFGERTRSERPVALGRSKVPNASKPVCASRSP